jgi:DNA helicase IV
MPLIPGNLVYWGAGPTGEHFAVVIDLQNSGRHARVRFDSGNEVVFSLASGTLGHVEFPLDLQVQIRSDGAVGRVTGRTDLAGCLTYDVMLTGGSIRSVPEADLRSVLFIRQAEAAATAQKRREDEAREQRRREDEDEAREQRLLKVNARAAADSRERARALQLEREGVQRRLDAAALATRRAALIGRLNACFESDFLSADIVFALDPARDVVSTEEYRRMKTDFVRAWAARELQDQLDDDQASAVATIGGDVKVIARAGSGKTRTLTTRAIFLQKHCGVSPRELLLLAFNKRAAAEMKTRLRQALGEDLPHVMTFHALAHALVHPDEDLVFDDQGAGQLGLSREIQEVIDDHIRSPEFRDRVRELMLAHFRDDWERIVDGRIELTIDEFLAYRRALPRETLRGDFVKSFGEREIANALFENAVPYAYERAHRWGAGNHRPDFTIPLSRSTGIIIEYFGLAGDPDYDEQSDAKRAHWATRDGWTLLEYSPRDLVRGGLAAFRGRLLEDLRALGVAPRARSEEEIWQEVRQRAIDRFTKTMKTFVGRCRTRNLSPDEVGLMIAAHTPVSKSERLFLEVAGSVHGGYLRRLETMNKLDFDGLVWRAAAQVREGQTRFVRDRGRENGDLARLRYVLVDEFQDFSEMFYELLSGVRQVSPEAEFFCVGDDWQAINGFAGADLRYFADFPEYFRDPSERGITTNYRSATSIVQAGNGVMTGLGEPARSHPAARTGRVQLCFLDRFEPSAFEIERHDYDVTTPAVLRLVRRFLDEGMSVVLLSRRNHVGDINYSDAAIGSVDGLERFVVHIRSFLPEEDRERVHASTAHRYKGLAQPAVIVLDAVEGSYPLIHPTWVFLRVFGDSIPRIKTDERRLFYVAVTRARDSLALITQSGRESPYLADLRQSGSCQILSWSALPEGASLDAPRLEVRVFDAYNVRDQLKDLKYRWQPSTLHWFRTVPELGFSFDALLGQPWVAGCGRIVVLSPSGNVVQAWSADSQSGAEFPAARITRRIETQP